MSSSMGAAADCIVPNKVKRIMKEKTFRTLEYFFFLLLLLLWGQEILGHLQHALSSLPECFNSCLLFCCGARRCMLKRIYEQDSWGGGRRSGAATRTEDE